MVCLPHADNKQKQIRVLRSKPRRPYEAILRQSMPGNSHIIFLCLVFVSYEMFMINHIGSKRLYLKRS